MCIDTSHSNYFRYGLRLKLSLRLTWLNYYIRGIILSISSKGYIFWWIVLNINTNKEGLNQKSDHMQGKLWGYCVAVMILANEECVFLTDSLASIQGKIILAYQFPTTCQDLEMMKHIKFLCFSIKVVWKTDAVYGLRCITTLYIVYFYTQMQEK